MTRARPGKVTVNLTAINSIFQIGGEAHQEAAEIGGQMRDTAVRSVAGSIVTGALSRSYRSAVSPSYLRLLVTLYTTVEHGKWYEDGTAAQGLGRIYPKRKKTLKFPTATGFAFPKSVRGQRPKHTMANAMRIVLIQRGLL